MNINPADLDAYLDEALPPEEMTRIEKMIRDEPTLVQQLATAQLRRDSGVHSLGDVWRRRRLSCPSRERLGSLLLGALPDALADYLWFHLNVVGCRYCLANLADLQNQEAENADATAESRRRKYFQSSAGMLRREK